MENMGKALLKSVLYSTHILFIVIVSVFIVLMSWIWSENSHFNLIMQRMWKYQIWNNCFRKTRVKDMRKMIGIDGTGASERDPSLLTKLSDLIQRKYT